MAEVQKYVFGSGPMGGPWRIGVGADELGAALGDPGVKDRTRAEVEDAIAKGVFGSPYVVVDGEPFWGIDRFDQIERWLSKGPF